MFAFPSTTLSGTFPATKSSSDGPLSRVEVNEGFVGVGTGATEAVANERMATPKDRCRSCCVSEVRAEAILKGTPVFRDAEEAA